MYRSWSKVKKSICHNQRMSADDEIRQQSFRHSASRFAPTTCVVAESHCCFMPHGFNHLEINEDACLIQELKYRKLFAAPGYAHNST